MHNQGIFTPNPGEYKDVSCGVCGRIMDVKRDVFGATGFAEGMSRSGHKHDRFTCPDRDEKWHKQALKLFQMAEDTPSKFLEEIFLQESSKVVHYKKCIKDSWRDF